MRVTPLDATIADLIVAPGPVRSPGLHVSTLIKRLLTIVDPGRFSGPLDPVRMEIGFLVERALEEAWRARQMSVWRPGEFTRDGVTGSPDALRVDDRGVAVDEIKATWMSPAGCPEDPKFWHWLVQLKAYCHLVDTRLARLHGLFINGDYKHGHVPEYRVWDLEFTDREVRENWAMILNARTAEEMP